MNDIWPTIFLVQALVAGIVTLVILAIRAVIDGRAGVSFGDLLTSIAVGLAVAIVPWLWSRLIFRRFRRGLETPPADMVRYRYGNLVTEVPLATSSGVLDHFDRFTDDARKVLVLAQDEAQRVSQPYIGTEHLLLGLVRERDSTGARVLESMGVELPKVRTAIEFIIGRGDRPVIGEVRFDTRGEAGDRARDRRGPRAGPSLRRHRTPAPRPDPGGNQHRLRGP